MASASSSPEPPKKGSQTSKSKSAKRSSRARRKSSSSEATSSSDQDDLQNSEEEIPASSKRKTRSSDVAPPSSRRLTRGSLAPSSIAAKAKPSDSATKTKNHVNMPDSPSKKPPNSRRVEVVIDKPSSPRKRLAGKQVEEDEQDEDSEPFKPSRPSRRSTRVANSETDDSEMEVELPAPKRKAKATSKKAADKTVTKRNGRGRPPKKGAQPRAASNEREEEESDESEAGSSESEWSTPPLEELEGPDFKELGSLELRDNENRSAKIRRNDLVKLLNGGADEPWYAAMQKLGGLERDFKLAEDAETGEPLRGSKGQLLKQLDIPWFSGAWLYTKKMFLDLPKSSTNWRWTPQVLAAMGKNEYIETDNLQWQTKDALACPYFSDDSATPRTSAVTAFRFNDTYPGVSSSGFRTSHPLRHFRAPVKKEVPPPIPSYFWGDGDESDLEDEFATAPWIRTSFAFKPSEDARRRASSKGQTRPDGTPVTFNKHSISRKAYYPARVQVYGPIAKKWFDVADLKRGEHYAAVNRAQELAGLLDDESSDSDDEVNGNDGSDSDSEPIAVNGKRKQLSSKSKVIRDSRKKARLAAVVESPLNQLAKCQIFRGGAYGLIGNSYLVTRAAELTKKFIDAEDSDDVAEEKEETERLLEDEKAWKKGVEERKKRGVDAGTPPKGYQWVCPLA